jgi:uncharacterized protein
MQTAELIRFGVFVAVVTLVYFLAAGILVRMALRRFGLIQRSNGKWTLRMQQVILGLAALGTFCILYGFFIEPYWPEVTHVRIVSSKLAKSSAPIRIVHISDVHSDRRPRLENRLPALIAAQKPDVILFTGDSVNSPEGLPVFRQLMTQLAKICPTFAVRGNWDVWYSSDLDLFGGTGVIELKSWEFPVRVRETEVWVAGVPVDSESKIPDVLDAIPPDSFSILLHHYPDEIETVAKHRADLYLAGHIHGGQIALPFYGALITLSKYGKQFEAGLYRVGETYLYVNRGIGMEGGRMPRVRFCARPEVTVIELIPPEEGSQ